MTTSRKKRRCLLACARKGMLLAQVNQRLHHERLDPISELQWNLWINYFVDIVSNDPYFEHELIYNNRSLAWFATEQNSRRTKLVTQ